MTTQDSATGALKYPKSTDGAMHVAIMSGGSGGSSSGLTDAELRASAVAVEILGMPSVARQVAVAVASTNIALTATCRRVSIKAVGGNARYSVGAVAQTATVTSHYIEASERLDIAVPLNANIAAIRETGVTTDSVIHITELV